MFNTVNGNGATVTEKLGLDSEVRELKFGSSFNPGNRGQQGAFHTIRYDFKPASVDKSKMATLEVGPSGQVTISMPHYDTSGSTSFKGSTRPYTKECVLIIDKDTGEVVLEKLSHNVQVKKTRQEGGSRSSSKVAPSLPGVPEGSRSSSSGRSSEQQKSPPKEEKIKSKSSSNSSSHQQQQQQHLHPSSAASSNQRRPNSPMIQTGPSRHSPSLHGHNSPSSNNHHHINPSTNPFDAIAGAARQEHQQSLLPSLTSIENLLITPQITTSKHCQPNSQQQGLTSSGSSSSNSNLKSNTLPASGEKSSTILSDSSSDSSSSSSSEDEDSSSFSDMEEVPVKPIQPPHIREKSAASHRSPQMTQMSMPSLSLLGGPPPNQDSSMSMPSHLLSEDLQLSDSD